MDIVYDDIVDYARYLVYKALSARGIDPYTVDTSRMISQTIHKLLSR